jgi:hypothetical protein
MTESKIKGWSRGTIVALLSGALVAIPTGVIGGPQVVPVEGVGYSVGSSLADNLKLFVGKKVYLTLDSGVVMAGVVKEVGDHLVHLEKLDGKEYFDALILVEDISAIDARFWQVQR